MAMPLAAAEVEGYLIDKKCSAKVVTEGGDAAKAHTADCALMPDCKASGYGVVSEDGKFLNFDEGGSEMAVTILELEKGNDSVKVAVNGTIKGDTIEVVAIQLSF